MCSVNGFGINCRPLLIRSYGNRTVQQPLKIPFVAAIVLEANGRKAELVSDVLRQTGRLAQDYINSGNWREVKLTLRFLGCLQGIFENDGIFPILEVLFERAVDLQTASSEDVSLLTFVSCADTRPTGMYIDRSF